MALGGLGLLDNRGAAEILGGTGGDRGATMTESLFYRFGSFPKVAALPHQIKGLVPLLAWIEPAAGFLKGGPRTTTTFFVGVVEGLPDVSPLPNELRLFWPTAMLQFVATEGKLRWVAFATDAEELKPPVKADPGPAAKITGITRREEKVFWRSDLDRFHKRKGAKEGEPGPSRLSFPATRLEFWDRSRLVTWWLRPDKN